MQRSKIRFLSQAAAVAALYTVLTGLSFALGLDKGVVQLRFSEMLTVLPCLLPAAVPGLFIGCFLSNLLYGAAVFDILFGSLATLLGAVFTYLLRRFPILSPFPPVIFNTAVIPLILRLVYGETSPYFYMMLTVAAGEFLSCVVFGLPFLFFIRRLDLPFLRPVNSKKG